MTIDTDELLQWARRCRYGATILLGVAVLLLLSTAALQAAEERASTVARGVARWQAKQAVREEVDDG